MQLSRPLLLVFQAAQAFAFYSNKFPLSAAFDPAFSWAVGELLEPRSVQVRLEQTRRLNLSTPYRSHVLLYASAQGRFRSMTTSTGRWLPRL